MSAVSHCNLSRDSVSWDEILSGLLTVKDMQTGNQEKCTFDELMKKII